VTILILEPCTVCLGDTRGKGFHKPQGVAAAIHEKALGSLLNLRRLGKALPIGFLELSQ